MTIDMPLTPDFKMFMQGYFIDESQSRAVPDKDRAFVMEHVKQVAERNEREIHDPNDTLDIAGWAHTAAYAQMLARLYGHNPVMAKDIIVMVDYELKKEDGGVFDTLVSCCNLLRGYENDGPYADTMLLLLQLPEDKAEDVKRMEESFPEILEVDDGAHYMTVLEAFGRLYHKDPAAGQRFSDKAKTILQSIPDRRHLAPADLLIRYIEDPKDAQTVKPLIDMGRYRKQFAQRCRRFY